MRMPNWKVIALVAIPVAFMSAIGAQAAPSITSLSVTSGPVGTAVTITGTNFGSPQGTSTVKFNGTAASVTSWSATSIAVTVPSAATTGNVVVTVSSVASNGVNFTVTPHITSLSITSGAVGAAVTITGTTFGSPQGTSTVKFNGTTATITSWGASSIAVTVPTGATTGNVVVTVSSQASNGSAFTVVAAPSITSLSITTGAVGASVTVTGTNFGATQGTSTIKFNGTIATGATWAASSITVPVPTGATSGNVVVHASGVDSNGSSFTVVAAPSITSVSPATGAVGAEVTIAGANLGALQGTGTVKFNGTLGTPTSWSASSVAVPVPSGATTGNVIVNASGVASNGLSFTVIPAPNITSLSVNTGAVGTSVTITGTNFGATQGSGTVSFNGTNASATSWSATSILTQVPTAATTGNVKVSAAGVASNGINFTVVETLAINSISPTSGPIGQQVSLTGTGLGATQGASTISLSGHTATVASWTDTNISAFVPTGATSGQFSLTVSGHNATSPTFNVTSLPSGWLDGDVGSVGLAGSAAFANGTFTVSGAGLGANFGSTTDALNFAYRPLSGDGTIVARVTGVPGGGSQAGVMIRDTLNAGAANGFAYFYPGTANGTFAFRASTGAATSSTDFAMSLPYWVKLVRTVNLISAFSSPDGLNWTQVGTSQTVTMGQNVNIGLATASGSTTALTSASFDNVSISSTAAPAPSITSLSATSGSIGSQVTITGNNFGATQSGSVVTLNGAPITINTWSTTSIVGTIPTSATSGYFVVSVAPTMNDSNPIYFTVTSQPLPTAWLDQDVGSVGAAGSATYMNGVFTLNGAGVGVNNGYNTDTLHFAYKSLSGDGVIIARVTSAQSSGIQAGVMIRESLNPGAANAYTYYNYAYADAEFTYRLTTAGTTLGPAQLAASALPYWVKVSRSGNIFSSYGSIDGVNWTQIGTAQTVTMAQNVFIGLATSSGSASSLATATFDNVSISSALAPSSVITSVSSTTGSTGSQVIINGSGFGAAQNGSAVLLNNAPVTVITWIDTSILVTIPSGATSGQLLVSVAPSMNDSNSIYFTVTNQPLPIAWLDADIGQVGITGSATFANSVFTVNGAGSLSYGYPTDAFHFAYQVLSGDGTIVARITSPQNPSVEAGVMIRETLGAGAANAYTYYDAAYTLGEFTYRLTTGDATAAPSQGNVVSSLPFWVKLVRSGNSFSSYSSLDGVNWTQIGISQTIVMAQSVFVGLAVASQNSGVLGTATFDNVSVSSTASPSPVITSVSATTGSVGSQIIINGSGFGASQNGSVVLLNTSPVTVNSWSATSILITIPVGASSGQLLASIAPSMNDTNAVYFTVTTQPLPTAWLDADVGQVGLVGSATFANGVFTVNGAGLGINDAYTADALHLVYQQLPGDGTLVARLSSMLGLSGAKAGVMIRESLGAGAANESSSYNWAYVSWEFAYRATTGGTTSATGISLPIPYWMKVVRSGNIISTLGSPDGVNWTQIGSQTIAMAQNVDIGFFASSGSTTALETATFDNVSVTVGTTPYITAISPTLGPVGTTVTVAGSSFGATHGTSALKINGATATSITSWTNNQIVAVVPAGATPGVGPVTVTVNSITSPSTVNFNVLNPTISSLSPPAAQVGSSVILNGAGFGASQGSSQVKFNGLVATAQSWSNTSVTVQVPTGATNGPVTLTEDGVASNGVAFTVSSPLTVTGISRNTGPIGSSVTITGTGFGSTQSNSTAAFYGANATVTGWSDTQITTTMSAGSSSGPVTVSIGGVTANGPWFTRTTTTNLTDSLGNPTTYVSALVGGTWVPFTVTGSGCSSCTVRGTLSNTYDTSGNLLSHTDELGRTTYYTYDFNGNVASVSAPISPGTFVTTAYTYNNFGEVLTSTDPMGNVTTKTYDAKGNLLTVTSPAPNGSTAPSMMQFTYNSLGELTQITDPLQHVTILTYYPTGLLNTITDAQQNVTTYTYDTHGNRTSVKDALQNQTAFAYDSGDRLKTITYPGSTGTTTFNYDSRGRRTSATDQNGKVTTYAYDDADRLTSVIDAATPGNVTTYGYDTESNLTSIRDANSHTTTFAYDAFGRIARTTFPSAFTEYCYYDAVGNLITKTDRKNQTINYTYDQLNRLSQKTYPDSTAVNYTYDNDSRLTQVTDPTGTYQFTFDNMGRLTGTTTQYTFLAGRNFTTGYSYDAASNRTGFTDPENGSTPYAYDSLNRLQTLTPPPAFTATGNFGFTYDALSRRTQMTRPNGIKTVYTYDNLSRLLSVLHQNGSTTLDGAVYTVDNAGYRLTGTPQPGGTASTFGYDPLYELTSATKAGSTTESYTYDPAGNRLGSLGLSPYSYNVSNQLSAIPSTTFTYDNNGNMLTKVDSTGTTNYVWDFENRLKSVTLPGTGGTISFKYDPFGRRIYKTSTSGTSIYGYDWQNVVEETNASGSAIARYVQTREIDEPLAMLRSSVTSYYHADGLGSITSLSNSAGSLVQTYTFDSFGIQTASSGSLVNPFRYAAREFDSETTLYYDRARYYQPVVGRFISEDPTGFMNELNFYRYAANSPLAWRDATGKGLQWFPIYDSFNDSLEKAEWIKCFIKLGFCGNELPEVHKGLQGQTSEQELNTAIAIQQSGNPNNSGAFADSNNLGQGLCQTQNCLDAIKACTEAIPLAGPISAPPWWKKIINYFSPDDLAKK